MNVVGYPIEEKEQNGTECKKKVRV